MMLTRFMSPFKMEGGTGEKTTTGYCSSMVVGLQTALLHISEAKSNNVVVKSAIKTHGLPVAVPATIDQYSCYLKSCQLCNKKLNLDKDVYMYRGDQGFCSIECRNRQIVLDEKREAEAATQRMMKSYKNTNNYNYNYNYNNNYNNKQDLHCTANAAARHETRLLLEDLRRRNNKLVISLRRQTRWTIVT